MEDPSTAEGRIVCAIVTVADTVRRARLGRPEGYARIAAALEELAAITRHHGQLAVEAAKSAIRECLLRPVDPSDIAWNVFRLFEVEDSETDWTLWLAATLSPENGPALSALMWRSLCQAIATGSTPPQPCEPAHRIAALEDWSLAATTRLHAGCVSRERADPAFGRTDIVIDGPGLFVVLENKLDAGWHDGDGEPQAVRYRAFGLKHRSADQLLGLVLLTKHDTFELDDRCRDYVRLPYRDLARTLRRNLRVALPADASAESVLTLWPAWLTIAAIERELLRLDISSWHRAPGSWQAINDLNEIHFHLRDEDRE